MRNYSSFAWAFFFNLIAPLFANSQQPGGVAGVKLWYITEKKGNSFQLRDSLHKNYPIYGPSTGRNMNFHPAFKVVDLDIEPFANFSFNQGTIAGIYYPALDNPSSKDFFWLDYLDDSVSLKANMVGVTRRQFNYGNSAKRTNLEVESSGPTVLENAMKTAVYMRATRKTYTSLWGEDKSSTFNSDFSGYLPELIIYNRTLTPLERVKVETYLSVKYGTTLDSSYIGSDGKVLWDINDKTLKSFHHRVCAIGKDSLAAIHQPKSNTSYEESFDNFTAFNKDADDSTILSSSDWKLIPKGESPSLYRSLTIGFFDPSMKNLQNGKLIFWGDDDATTDTAEFKVRYKNQFPTLRTIKRQWVLQNKEMIKEPLKIVVAGGDYNAQTLFNSLYDPYDYQLYRFVLIKKNKPEDLQIEKPVLNDYFIREQSRSSVEFNTRAIVWDSILLSNHSANTYFSFGKVDILNFLSITSLFNKKTRFFEYPYYEDSAIRTPTHFDTATVVFNYVNGDSLLKFSFKTSVGVGALQVKLYLTASNGSRILLPASFIANPTAVIDTSKTSTPSSTNENLGTTVLGASDDNPSNTPTNPRKPIKYIVRRKRPETQKFREFQVKIPLRTPLDIKSRFLIEVTDDLGQITTLPVRIKTSISTN